MDGVVKSYVAEKRFGFIDGNDGKSYFFHLTHFVDRQAPEAIREGLMLRFDPTPGPKGLQARRIHIEKTHAVMLVEPDKFIVSKDQDPRYGVVLYRAPRIEFESDESIDKAKNRLFEQAASIGANAILSLTYRRDTGHAGNYVYSIHAYSGHPAIVMHEKASTDVAKIESGALRAGEMVKRLRDGHAAYLRWLDEERRKKSGKEALYMAVVVFVVMVIVLAAFFMR